MLANSKGQDLISHLKATANISKAMAIHLGLSEELINKIYVAGLLHDIGKAVPSFQNFIGGTPSALIVDEDFQDPIIGSPLHHEVGWAYLTEKIGDEQILNAVYWHHARPIHPDGDKRTKTYDSASQILETLSSADRKSLDALWAQLLPLFPMGLNLGNLSDPEKSIEVPSLFVVDDGNKNYNAIFMLVRACVISADRHISALGVTLVELLAGNKVSAKDEVVAMLSGGIQVEIILPIGYDQDRFDLQQVVTNLAGDGRTVIVKAPAGLGKTLIGILWSKLRAGKVLWVCHRNAVTDAVYENIVKEIDNIGLSCTVELYRTGIRQKTNKENDRDPFDSDIIVTNIDAIMSPMVNNRVAGKLFTVYGAHVVLDEFHEFVSDAPLFAAFVTYMRARHRIACNCKTLLLSATPSLVQTLWDTDSIKTLILPNEEEHYAPQHKGTYKIAFDNGLPGVAVPGSLLVCNSVSEAQNNYKTCGYKHIIHHRYTEKDRKKIEEAIKTSFFGTHAKGVFNGESLSAALVVQAAMDISFKALYDSVCSPESTLQRIGRTDRWGTFQSLLPSITFLDLRVKKNESGAIRTVYNSELQTLWYAFLNKELTDSTSVNLDRMYKVYNKFLQTYRKGIMTYLKDQYLTGMNGPDKKREFLGLIEFSPKKLLNTESVVKKNIKSSQKNLRNPDGSYFYTVELVGNTNVWLPPEDVLSEGRELYSRYVSNAVLNLGLLTSGSMLTRLKGLVSCGYQAWTRHSKGKAKIPSNLSDWFRKARDPVTPLPDFSRKYDSVLGVI